MNYGILFRVESADGGGGENHGSCIIFVAVTSPSFHKGARDAGQANVLPDFRAKVEVMACEASSLTTQSLDNQLN